MTLPCAYGSAAARHWEDALLLLRNDRFDNAGYLSGYVVECSLKALIEASGDAARRYHHELGTLSGDALFLACLIAPALRRYQLPASADFTKMVAEWAPERRYCPSGDLPAATAQRWIEVAERIYRAVVVKMILDGQETIR
jgi:HEPN domain-containing protein